MSSAHVSSHPIPIFSSILASLRVVFAAVSKLFLILVFHFLHQTRNTHDVKTGRNMHDASFSYSITVMVAWLGVFHRGR
jgi:hypothetical protein